MSSCALLLLHHCHRLDLFQSLEEEDELLVKAGEVEEDEVVMDSA
jgi:hypothetical protein